MANLNDEINEIIDDLNLKIENLNKAGKGANAEALDKIKTIRNKAIKVLNNASDKISEIARDVSDADEVQKGINIVKVKSKELYENAIKKINALSENSELLDSETEEIINEVKNNISSFFQREDVKNSIDSVKKATDDVADKAVNTLKDWLKPKEK